MDNNVIQEVNSHKHLGLTFSNDGTWHEVLEPYPLLNLLNVRLIHKHIKGRPFIFVVIGLDKSIIPDYELIVVL